MSQIISFEYLKRAIDYFKELGLELNERNHYERLHDCRSVRRRISNDSNLSRKDKRGIRKIIECLEDSAEEIFFKRGYGL